MRILMLGNSFTSANNLPELLAKKTGAEVVHHTRGGARLAEHLNSGTKMGARTLTALECEHWDYVVLQEMSNGPLTTKEKYLKSISALCSMIRDAGAVPLIYATWAYEKNGSKLASFGMDYREMAIRMAEVCAEAASRHAALLAPVGSRFLELADQESLYAEDGCHPNKRGTEIAAETIASVILEDWKLRGKQKQTGEFSSLDDAVHSLFSMDTAVTGTFPLQGGDINAAWLVKLSNGKRIFMKSNRGDRLDLFRKEALGLQALKSADAIGVPKVLAVGKDADREEAFLLLEYLEPAVREETYWQQFGRELASLHLAETKGFIPQDASGCRFGFLTDNYIGNNEQLNTPSLSWIDFYREQRLEPQIRMAEEYLGGTLLRKMIRLLDILDRYLREPAVPSLLHGDLWSGNQITGPNGKAWIIDPAVYVGDAEADLAMTELFGAFPESFYRSYAEVFPIEPEYGERRDLYHLYHLLNHLNLFGEEYLEDVRSIVEQY